MKKIMPLDMETSTLLNIYLLDHQCVRLDLYNIKGSNSFQMAAENNHNDILELLLQHYSFKFIDFIYLSLDSFLIDSGFCDSYYLGFIGLVCLILGKVKKREILLRN